MSTNKSTAHRRDMNHFGAQQFPDGLVPWREATAPDVDAGRNTGRLRSCGYCGSMHPADVADSIRRGARGHWADRKYGWPHKAYFDNVPNPHAGVSEVRAWSSHPSPEFPREVREPRFDSKTGKRIDDYVTYTAEPKAAGAMTDGKFYSVHLQDATPEDRALIEKHLGLAFTFGDDNRVTWAPVTV